MKRNIQMHLHTSASPRLYKERNGTPRLSMEVRRGASRHPPGIVTLTVLDCQDHVEKKLAPLPPYTPRKYAAERLLPRNLVDAEDDEVSAHAPGACCSNFKGFARLGIAKELGFFSKSHCPRRVLIES